MVFILSYVIWQVWYVGTMCTATLMTHIRAKFQHIRRYHDVRSGTFYDFYEGQVVLVLSTRYEGNI